MDIPFSTKTARDGKITYRIHPVYRFFNAVVFVVITASVAVYAPNSILGYICAIAALAGTLYEERWTFTAEEMIYSSGFFPFCPLRRHAMADLRSIRVEAFAKGELDQSKAPAMLSKMDDMPRRKNPFPGGVARRMKLRLILGFDDGQTFLVDETGPRSRPRLDALAATLSDLTGIGLER